LILGESCLGDFLAVPLSVGGNAESPINTHSIRSEKGKML
jgi:hypothetical protein